MGETLTTGLVRDDWDVCRDGRLCWSDALCLDEAIAETVAHPAGLAGATALATAIYVADDAGDHLSTARELLCDAPLAVRCGASCVNSVLVVRFLSDNAQTLRAAYGDFWAGFRNAVADLPARLPRLWHI